MAKTCGAVEGNAVEMLQNNARCRKKIRTKEFLSYLSLRTLICPSMDSLATKLFRDENSGLRKMAHQWERDSVRQVLKEDCCFRFARAWDSVASQRGMDAAERCPPSLKLRKQELFTLSVIEDSG